MTTVSSLFGNSIRSYQLSAVSSQPRERERGPPRSLSTLTSQLSSFSATRHFFPESVPKRDNHLCGNELRATSRATKAGRGDIMSGRHDGACLLHDGTARRSVPATRWDGTTERACCTMGRHGGACLLHDGTARRSLPATRWDGTTERACYTMGRHGGACLLRSSRHHCAAERVPLGAPPMGNPSGSGRAAAAKPSFVNSALSVRNWWKLSG